MYYFYDLLINFQDEAIYEFYEWEEKDSIELIKKIPLFKISNNDFKDLLKYRVKFNIELLNKIKNKTLLKNNNETIEYAFLASDGKNALALELDKEGVVIATSKLLLSDEINLSEIMFTIKEVKLEYHKQNKYKVRKFIRQVENIKKIIKIEIDNLYKAKSLSKLKYLYLEWFGEISNDCDYIYNKMIKELENKINIKEEKIKDLIKLSYNK